VERESDIFIHSLDCEEVDLNKRAQELSTGAKGQVSGIEILILHSKKPLN
jgi:hypothetical protein